MAPCKCWTIPARCSHIAGSCRMAGSQRPALDRRPPQGGAGSRGLRAAPCNRQSGCGGTGHVQFESDDDNKASEAARRRRWCVHTEARGVAADGSAVANSYKLRGSRRARAHPAAKVFPLLKDDGIDLLAEDIKDKCLQSAVAIQKTKDGDYLVLDGRNRLRACELVGVEPDVRHVGPRVDPVKFIVSANLQRRHQSASQRAMAGPGWPTSGAAADRENCLD